MRQQPLGPESCCFIFHLGSNHHYMKLKYLLFVFTILFARISFGQVQKGTWLTGGNIIMNLTDYHSEFSLTPDIGYFLKNSLCTGVFSEISSNKYKTDDTRDFQFSFGPLLRYYFSFGKFAAFPECKASYGLLKTHYTDWDGSAAKTNGNILKVKPGIGLAFFITSNVSVETLFSYYWEKRNYQMMEQSSAYDYKDYERGFNFSAGLHAYIQRKEK